eukprot:TRINITY_DN21974_c0_g1_i1.p1 TRINITY_DN21974_c0_g1~~TRINITY_DN21974_c0_g1_i1.p1  ORF type:complete len:211 (+),score=46.00 TRINITY_DN21974_c0_g1_i1:52-684(+)
MEVQVGVDDDILDALEEAIVADEVQQAGEQFLLQSLPLFEDMTDEQLNADSLGEDEHRLEWHEAYKTYVSLMEHKVIDVCAASNPSFTSEGIYKALSSIAEAAPDDEASGAAKLWARFLLSMFEYDSFLLMIKQNLRRKRDGLPLLIGIRRDGGEMAGKLEDAVFQEFAALSDQQDIVLPPHWTSALDQASGKPYYYNTATGATQWEVPH